MKPRELRIGNYVYPNQAARIYADIREIKQASVKFTDWLEVDVDSLVPIPLTEELLTKNWIKDEYESRYPLTQDGKLHITVQHPLAFWKDQSICFTALFYGEPIGKISSIHQLQNLYFALTGQELEITL